MGDLEETTVAESAMKSQEHEEDKDSFVSPERTPTPTQRTQRSSTPTLDVAGEFFDILSASSISLFPFQHTLPVL